MAYMEMFGNISPGNTNEMFRRSIDNYNILQAEWQEHEMLLTSAHSCSFDVFCSSQRCQMYLFYDLLFAKEPIVFFLI